MADDITTLHEFENAVRSHDLTHMYSDDGQVYERGYQDRRRIERAAEKFPREDVERIWNAMVDSRLLEDCRAQFYWRWPQS